MMETKICKKCGRELPLSEFHKDKCKKDGYCCQCKECQKKYYREHKEVILEQKKQYNKEHKEEKTEYNKQYNKEHKEEKTKYNKQYRQTQMGRANILVSNYKRHDKDANRGECTLTPEWIIDNIFTSKCHWCGETDWNELGCDRIDNDKPHTPDNVNPCCDKCNKKRGNKTYEEFLELIKAPVTYV